MRGIECAFMATIGQDIELKMSRSGKPFCSFGAVVTVVTEEDGKDTSQWLRIGCFGEAAEKLAARAKKGDKIYVEGALTMTQWNDAHGSKARIERRRLEMRAPFEHRPKPRPLHVCAG